MKKIYTIKLFLLLLVTAAFVAGCNKEEEKSPFAGNDNYIAAFTLVKDGVTLKGAVSPDAIVITAPERFSLAGAAASVTLSENATITPEPATITDWNTAQTFTVISYSGATHHYDYSVERRMISRDGDVVLLTQADVEAFAEEVKDIDQINGSITIGAATGEDTITSLAGVEHLKVITEGLIFNATYNGDITAFENLEKTGEIRILSKNVKTVRFPKLAALRAGLTVETIVLLETVDFPELLTIDKGLRIFQIDSLATLNFPKLQQVIGEIYLYGRRNGSPNFRNVEFPELKNVGGYIYVAYWKALERIVAPKLETVGGYLRLLDCSAVADIDFRTLKTVNGNLEIGVTTVAEMIFPKLETVTGNISFSSAALTAQDFSALQTAGGLTVPDVANPVPLHFPKLKYIANSLQINLQSLTSLDAFSALDSVGGSLTLDNLSNLTSLDGLSSLKKVGSLYLYELTNLTEVDVRNIEVGSLSLDGSTYNGLSLIGNSKFPGTLNFSTAADATVMPTVQGFEEVGHLSISLTTHKTVEIPWVKRITGSLTFTSGGSVEIFSLPNVQSIGHLRIYNLSFLHTINLPNLEKFTGYTNEYGIAAGGFEYNVSSNVITTVEFPKLKSVAGEIRIWPLSANNKLEHIRFPVLESLTGTLTITGTNNTSFKDLSGFATLKSAGGITINGFTKLKNFEPLKNIIPSLAADAWSIMNCGYIPSYQDMLDGKYSNE
jgi:hypothetical protein